MIEAICKAIFLLKRPIKCQKMKLPQGNVLDNKSIHCQQKYQQDYLATWVTVQEKGGSRQKGLRLSNSHTATGIICPFHWAFQTLALLTNTKLEAKDWKNTNQLQQDLVKVWLHLQQSENALKVLVVFTNYFRQLGSECNVILAYQTSYITVPCYLVLSKCYSSDKRDLSQTGLVMMSSPEKSCFSQATCKYSLHMIHPFWKWCVCLHLATL